MTVQELIDDLLTVKDKSIEVIIQGLTTDYVYYNELKMCEDVMKYF
jgi:hypothetical protein